MMVSGRIRGSWGQLEEVSSLIRKWQNLLTMDHIVAIMPYNSMIMGVQQSTSTCKRDRLCCHFSLVQYNMKPTEFFTRQKWKENTLHLQKCL